jgi:DnaJ-like protein
MRASESPQIDADEARALLGLAADDATDEQIRAAYLEKVRRHPPDRDPELFEKIRDAYDLLRDRRQRARQILVAPDPAAPLVDLLAGTSSQRRFVGPGPWLEAIKERRS